MAIINSPPNSAVDTGIGERGMFRLVEVAREWRNFFNAVFNICNALTQSGSTALRPQTMLWIGRTYFDVTLGIPIWVQSLSPTVWVDATGAPV